MKTEMIKVKDLKPYEKNARKHEAADVAAIAESIKAFGFRDPVGVWGPQNVIVEGHGRVLAAKQLGITEVPCIRLDDLTDEQRRAYALAHNRTAELSTWDAEVLPLELEDCPSYDMTDFGFDIGRVADSWFEERERMDDSRQEGNDEYNEFLDKFEPKKTTDDCYTPDLVYDAVADWVAAEYGLDRKHFVRPFYPGGDYQKEEYAKNDVVVDNPPFSILSQILKWYKENGVRFFLFAPTLTLFSSSSTACAIPTGATVIYENGASVNTSFLTNLEDPGLRVRTAPVLQKAVQDASDTVRAQQTKELPKYSYPDYVITSAMVARWSKYGIDFRLSVADSVQIEALDAQKEAGKAIFGKGYLLSERAAAERAAAERAAAERAAAERAAAERAAAERAAAHRWGLSERERAIVRSLGGGDELSGNV
ncbi:MAG: ParB N-terminal domain-containing protein [Clostridia bacterium]|nr:ParB N-terminal domain-containing protein [Clostridia bacterium]